MITEIGLIGLGFGLGVLFSHLRSEVKEKDLLDRISWRNPEDYFFMKWQREQAAKKKPEVKIPSFGFLKKQDKPEMIKLDPQKVSDNISKQIENQISAKEEATKNQKDYLNFRENAAKAAISTP